MTTRKTGAFGARGVRIDTSAGTRTLHINVEEHVKDLPEITRLSICYCVLRNIAQGTADSVIDGIDGEAKLKLQAALELINGAIKIEDRRRAGRGTVTR